MNKTPQRLSPHLAKAFGLATDRFPKSDEEVTKAEDAIAKAMQNLSLEDQEKVIFDIHGIATNPSQAQLERERLLRDFQDKLDRITSKDAYEQARFQNPSYVNDPDFRYLFLHAVGFDVREAAKMYVYHFEKKRQLFGDDVLGRDVCQSDLTDVDLFRLREGWHQICPEKDLSGRTVAVINVGLSEFCDTEEFSRALFYHYMTHIQRQGVAQNDSLWVLFNLSETWTDYKGMDEIFSVGAAMPLRIVCGHYCATNTLKMRALTVGLQLFQCSRSLLRIRPHLGTLEELIFQLQTFGIRTDAFPLRPDGTWCTRDYNDWLDKQRELEEARQSMTGGTILPSRHDVLLGKSKRARLAPGTVHALKLVKQYQHDYESRTKREKTDIGESIVANIRHDGGRFLKQDKGGLWIEMDDREALLKISHWFRHLRFKERDASGLVDGGDDYSP